MIKAPTPTLWGDEGNLIAQARGNFRLRDVDRHADVRDVLSRSLLLNMEVFGLSRAYRENLYFAMGIAAHKKGGRYMVERMVSLVMRHLDGLTFLHRTLFEAHLGVVFANYTGYFPPQDALTKSTQNVLHAAVVLLLLQAEP